MKWFTRLACLRRPDGVSDIGMYWSLLTTRWFGVALVLRYRSDSSFNQRAESNRIKILLEGEVLEHYELPRTGDAEPAQKVEAGAYVYRDVLGLWCCRRLSPKRIVFERHGRRGGLELLDSKEPGSRVLFLPWMEAGESLETTDRPAYFLTITWGGCWR